MKTYRFLPLVFALCAASALADTPINLSHPATANVQLEVRNVKGAVRITAWDRNEVQVTGRLGEGARPLSIDGDEHALSIKVEPQGKSGWFGWNSDNAMSPSTLDLRVPRGASLDLNVVSASVNVDGLRGGKIETNAVSGRVQISADTPSLDVQSVSGNIELAGHADRADLQTVSGDILAPALGRRAELQTVSGRIRVAGGPWEKVDLSTVSGDVQLSGGLASGGTIDIDSMSGNVQLQLPAAVSASIKASSFSGDLRSDFGTPSEHEHGPGSELDTRAGSGDGSIHAETFSGDLRIRKGD